MTEQSKTQQQATQQAAPAAPKRTRARKPTAQRESGKPVNIPGPDDATTQDLALVTASGRVITPEEASDIRQLVFESIGQYIEQSKFELLMQPPPKYAIKYREGGSKTMYPYLKHGYVRLKMTQIFGIDWSHELLPVFAGEPYRMMSGEDSRLVTNNPSMMVYGRLIVNVRSVKRGGGAALLSIVRTGFGSTEWRNKQEPGDALKGAQSDAFKVAAATLGPALGLTLYWDDEANYTEAVKVESNLEELRVAAMAYAAQQATQPPKNFAELNQRAKAKYGLGMQGIVSVLKTTIAEVGAVIAADPAGTWQRIVDSQENKAQSVTTPAAQQPASVVIEGTSTATAAPASEPPPAEQASTSSDTTPTEH